MPVIRFDVLVGHNTTARERILHALLCEISNRATVFNEDDLQKAELGEIGHYPALGPERRGIQVGDMVMGMCGAIGQVVAIPGKNGDGLALLIAGTDRIEDWTNESFSKFIGVESWLILPEDKFRFYVHARTKICADENEYEQRFHSVEFDGEDAIISFRRRWSDSKATVRIPDWKRFVSRKRPPSIIRLLILAGWGSPEFLPHAPGTPSI